jgi:hypothetical protein
MQISKEGIKCNESVGNTVAVKYFYRDEKGKPG